MRKPLSFSASLTRIAVCCAIFFATGSVAFADFSKKVTATFKGQVVVSAAELPSSGSDKAVVDGIKKARLSEVSGTGTDVKSWTFQYTAFLKKTGAASLTMKFFTADKAANYAANQSLSGINPKLTVLSGQLTITEDEGLAAGKTYVVKLVTDGGATVAETKLTVK